MLKLIIFLYLFININVFADVRKDSKEEGYKIGVYIISGFDDVLRQAENTGLFKAGIKLFERDKGFAGMPELYRVIANPNDTTKFVLISAISNWFDTRISKFLENENFPANKRYLRNWLTEWTIEKFKLENIRNILFEYPERKFIVVFDNSDASLNLASQIHQKFSEKVISIYLRKVQNKPSPNHANEFYTAFDIAVKEFESGRLSKNDIAKVANAILSEKNVELIIPHYSICPQNYKPCLRLTNEIQNTCSDVENHIRNLCNKSSAN